MSVYNSDEILETQYFSTFNDEFDKNYKYLLAQPGRVLQAKEITDLMFYPFKMITQTSDIIFNYSRILEGIEYSEMDKISNVSFCSN